MQVGDKKKAGLLSVVAVGAVGFLIFQLVPKADARTPAKPVLKTAASTPAPSASVAPAPLDAASSALVVPKRDPFGVDPTPNLRRSQTAAKKGEPETKQEDPAKTETNAGRAPKSEPSVALPPAGGAFAEFVLPQAPAPKPAIAKPSPPRPAPPKPVKILVRVLGIVEAPTPIAMLLVGERERTARVGDAIAPGLRVATISLAGVTFVKRPSPLAPGEEALL